MYVDGLGYQDFINDLKTQDAVIRALEILGEASKRMSPSIKSQFPDIPWKLMAGMRDKLIHEYFGVNLDVVWEVVTNNLPALFSQIECILTGEAE